MQFISNGPDIPNELLQAHEDDKVVFFCGAGISCAAGLPTFEQLVKQIHKKISTKKRNKKTSLDVELNYLEQEYSSLKVRSILSEIISKPDLQRHGAKDTHKALLELGKTKSGDLHLITTNYDRLFHIASPKKGKELKYFAAPLLPIPKINNWNGLVFLHGLLPEVPDENTLSRLVLTSSDFGLAYLTERWASRFLTNLFKTYEVCFVGYSLNDPVLRYIVDALAADRRQGEIASKTWALVSCQPDQEEVMKEEWQKKGVIPIFYSNENNYFALHKTLKEWAKAYKQGIISKTNIASKYASYIPSRSTIQDNFIGRMLWAITDISGQPAKAFAHKHPTPPLEWLIDVFSKNYFQSTDLARFGFINYACPCKDLKFSLVQRPATPCLSEPMRLVSSGETETKWDKVMDYLAEWIVRCLDDHRLLIWFIQQGGKLHYKLKEKIQKELQENYNLHKQKNNILYDLWNLLLNNQILTNEIYLSGFEWVNSFKKEGLTIHLKLKLIKLLEPKVKIPGYYLLDKLNQNNPIQADSNFDLAFIDSDLLYELKSISNTTEWKSALPLLLNDIQCILVNSLNLMKIWTKVNDLSDPSSFRMPSIEPHDQNKKFDNLTFLIELLRDSWLELLEIHPSQACRTALEWFDMPYLTFKRLALFAACKAHLIDSEIWINWLLKDSQKYLWLPSAKREVSQLLKNRANELKKAKQYALEKAIISNPQKDELGIWLRLKKMQSSGITLSHRSINILKKISNNHPEFSFHESEKEEFSVWSEVRLYSGNSTNINSQNLFTTKEEIKQLITSNEDNICEFRNNWKKACKEKPFECLNALFELADAKIWPMNYWHESFSVWSDEILLVETFDSLSRFVLQKIPDAQFKELIQSISFWLNSLSESNEINTEEVFKIYLKILKTQPDTDFDKNIIYSFNEAINTPIGIATEALLNIIAKDRKNDGDKIPENIAEILSTILNSNNLTLLPAKIILAANLNYLYRLDLEWTREYLLPLFNWKTNEREATHAWKGFLQSPRAFSPLMKDLKPFFLDTASHYKNLEESSYSLAYFLTLSALEGIPYFRKDYWRRIISNLPQDGIDQVASTLLEIYKETSDNNREFAYKKIKIFWETIWPQNQDVFSESVSASLSEICINSQNLFPETFELFNNALKHINQPSKIVEKLSQSNLCNEFPEESLKFLKKIIPNNIFDIQNLNACLSKITSKEPSLAKNPDYINLLRNADTPR